VTGNKADLHQQRQVAQEEGIALARKHSFFFIETSALTAANVHSAFEVLLTGTTAVSPNPLNATQWQSINGLQFLH
jgi:hypothetical protein